MRLKQKLSATLAVLLIMLHGFSAFAITADELQEQEEAVTMQDSGTSSEPSNNQNKPSDAVEPQEPEYPETDGGAKEPSPPEEINTTVETKEIQTPSDAPPPKAPIIPVFSIELVEGGEEPGLYGTLNYIPEDTTHITVLYSFGGVDFEPAVSSDDGKDRAWDLSGLSKEDGQPKLTQLCAGVNDHSLKAYQSGEVNSLYIKLEIKRESEISQTESVKLSRDETLPIPDTPPAFFAKIELIVGSYVLKGTFTDFLPNTAQIRPMYSLDGEFYKPIGVDEKSRDWDLSLLESENPKEQARLQNQTCAYSRDEPMDSYLKQGLERFYIKLQITTKTGETYDTQATVIERGTPQPPPENTTVSAIFPASLRAVDKGEIPPYAYGKYQITVREDATTEDVYMLLPNTLPIEVRIANPDTGVPITTGIVECEVTWKEPPKLELTAGEAFTIPDAANELLVPAGTEVSTPLGIYLLPEAIGLDGSEASDEVRIVVNVIGKEEKPDISLTGNTNDDFVDGFEPLSLAFRLKPSGATSVKAYSYVEGDEDWTELCELLSFRDINANQSAELYGYVDVSQPDKSPYAEYLKGEITGFLIGILIEGGTFGGERVILPWPGEYNSPTQVPELDGSGGNEGNAGSGDGSGDSTEGGQRPDLPDEEAPPVTVPPPGTSDPPDSSGTTPSTPENPEPSVPSMPDGTATPSPPTDTAEKEGSTVSPTPPADPDPMLPAEEAGKDILPPANLLPGTPEKPEPSVPSMPDGTATPSPPTDTAEKEGGTVSPTPPANSGTMLPTEEAGKDTLPLANQSPIKPEYPAEHPTVTSQGNTFAAENKPDNRENTASSPTEPEVDKAAKLPVWNETKPQEQTQEKSDVQAVTKEASDAEKTRGLPVPAAVLLLGGGVVAVAGAGSAAGGLAGKSTVAKLLTALKNLLRHP